ncbi:hypothetical protein [Streptomyces sp. NPDC060194]|uniref:hypothetical protein n=1 Tax=Streptomyces sp. NPDC060194 TaxID=3347069 RepID=UPI0036655D97
MTAASVRKLAAGAVVLALSAVTAGCSGEDRAAQPAPKAKEAVQAGPPKAPVRLIGDGSTSVTGAQPNQRPVTRLKPGQKPPQFVVFSWDGAGEDSQKLFSHFRKVSKKYNAHMTYFLSGVYLVPTEKNDLYRPPGRAAGRSDIGFNDVKSIKATVEQLRGAWLEGSEIGTHFNGHFCGANGVGSWSPAQWRSEIEQAKSFVKTWKTNTGLKGVAALPFDYEKELVGARTPCLEGQKNMMAAARHMGFRYDSSGVGTQVWPGKKQGLWDMPLQQVPVPGRAFETLSMDYNFMVNQSGTVKGDPAKHAYWGNQMRDGLLAAFKRAYEGNRAPLIIGNHFESWNGRTYMRAIEETVKTVCTRSEVRCVSFRQLADWLDAQDPKTLAKLRTLQVGEAPKGGWSPFLSPKPAAEQPKAPASGAAGAPEAGGAQAD